MAAIDLKGKTVCVLDTHGILYQVFHTIRDMSSPQGEPTGAVFGFVRDLISLLQNHKIDYLFCAFDKAGPTFRHEIYELYKANRQAMPDDLRPQIGFVQDFIDAFGIKSIGLEKFEADDLLATIAKQTEAAGGRCILVTGDKDARQLITDQVSLYILRKQILYTAKELQVDWGVRPDQVVDFQTMVGDSTDNVPGIPLIGPKTATQLLQEFGTLENIFAHVDSLKGKKKENIAAAQETSALTRQLVKLRDDVPLEIDWESARFRGIDRDRLQVLFRYFGFRAFSAKADELAASFGKIQLPSDPCFDAKYRKDTWGVTADPSAVRAKIAGTSSSSGTGTFSEARRSDGRSASRQLTLFGSDDPWEAEDNIVNENTVTVSDQSGEFDQKDSGSANTVPWEEEGSAGSIPAEGSESKFKVGANQNSNGGGSFDGPVVDPMSREKFFAMIESENSDLEEKLRNDYRIHFEEKNFSQRYPEEVDYVLIETDEQFETFMEDLRKQDFFCIDLETTDTRPRFASPVGVAICHETGRAFYIPVKGPLGAQVLDSEKVFGALRPILEDSSIRKIGQNIKYDMIVLRNVGIFLKGVAFDTMVADYLLNTGARLHNMDEMADRYFNYKTIKISELIGVGKKQRKMNEVQTDLVARYAGEDAHVTWLLFAALYGRLQSEPELLRLLIRLELPLIDMLADLEYTGIAVNSDHFRKLSATFQERLILLGTQIRDMVAECDSDDLFAQNFNINSNQQLQRVLFDDLKLPSAKKTKTGKSTDIEVLEELAFIHPLPKKIIEYRQLTKLKGTYLDPIPLLRHPETGRIHTSFNQVVTATGRLSSSDPNLQNIPVRSEDGNLIRQGFVPDAAKGFTQMLSCDYSQIELRMLAHFSKDENLWRAFQEDIDIHTHVAANIFNVPLEEVTSEMRRKAKAVNFGLVYGQSSFGLAKSLNIPREEAAEYIDTFFKTYPGIFEFLEKVLDSCRRDGLVSTIMGRKRRVEGVRPFTKGALNMPERIAVNTVIQGSAADLMKLAMIKVRTRLTKVEKSVPEKANILLQIHDELVFETSEDYLAELASVVRQEMMLGQPISVPLKVDADFGPDWGNLKSLEI